MGHFSTGGHENLKTRSLTFSLKRAKMHSGYSSSRIKNFMAKIDFVSFGLGSSGKYRI